MSQEQELRRRIHALYRAGEALAPGSDIQVRIEYDGTYAVAVGATGSHAPTSLARATGYDIERLLRAVERALQDQLNKRVKELSEAVKRLAGDAGERYLRQSEHAGAQALKMAEQMRQEGWREDFPDSFVKEVRPEEVEAEKKRLETLPVKPPEGALRQVPVHTPVSSAEREQAALEELLRDLRTALTEKILDVDGEPGKWLITYDEDGVLVVRCNDSNLPNLDGEPLSLVVRTANARLEALEKEPGWERAQEEFQEEVDALKGRTA